MLKDGPSQAPHETGRTGRTKMAKIRVKNPGKSSRTKKGLLQENVRAIPCLLLVILAIVLVSYVFYIGLKAS
jgi:hypothetical protein